MPVPNSTTFTPFDTLPASRLNDLIENDQALSDGTAIDNLALDITSISNPYKFRVYKSGGTYSWASGAYPFNTEDFDTNGDFDTGTGLYTAPVTGFYFLSASIWVDNTSTGFITMYRNGTDPVVNLGPADGSTGNKTWSGSSIFPLTAGDTVGVYTGAPFNVEANQTHFCGFLISHT